MQKHNAFPIAACVMAAFSALLAIGVLTFAGPCMHDDGTVSACFGASRVLVGIGVCAAAVSVTRVLVTSAKAQRILTAAVLIMGACAVVLPGNVLSLCMMATMRCNAVMRPFGLAMGASMAIAAVVDLVLSARAKDAR